MNTSSQDLDTLEKMDLKSQEMDHKSSRLLKGYSRTPSCNGLDLDQEIPWDFRLVFAYMDTIWTHKLLLLKQH